MTKEAVERTFTVLDSRRFTVPTLFNSLLFTILQFSLYGCLVKIVDRQSEFLKFTKLVDRWNSFMRLSARAGYYPLIATDHEFQATITRQLSSHSRRCYHLKGILQIESFDCHRCSVSNLT